MWALGALPLGLLAAQALRQDLGANPVERITHETGIWALRFLVATLAVTPLREWLGWPWLAPHRRTLGLLSFAYASAHLATYLILDQGLAWDFIGEDVLERPYVTAGALAFAALLPLAATSTHGWIRRLGRRWIQLHRLTYLAATAALVHFVWLVKADLAEPAAYGACLLALLGARLARKLHPRSARAGARRAHSPLPAAKSR